MLFTYLFRELRRRHRQALVVAIGLAVGIGLVITVSAASSGVKTAQTKVLHSLYGVGTDITVTKTATGGQFGQRFAGPGQAPSGSGTIDRTTIRPTAGSGTLTDADVATARRISGVNAAAASLGLQVTHISGTFGSSSGSTSGGFPNINLTTTSLMGVQPTSSGIGALSSSQIVSGKYFSSAAATKDAIVSSTYASGHSLKVGSTFTLDGNSLTVIGVAKVSSSSATAADVYVTLREAQGLASLSGKVTTIYVSATSASEVPSVQRQLKTLLPGATITTSSDLANEVSGSLSSASNLANTLGKWLSILVLIAAFLVAALLMMAAVSRRVREFGTLKAIGWRTRRVVGQVMSEGAALGIAGGILGIILGVIGAELVSLVAPTLSATVGPSFATGGSANGPPGGFGGGNGGLGGANAPSGRPSGGGFGARAADLTHTVLVHLSAPIQGSAVGLAIVLAVAGGLIAGAFGAWRAARLRPADALRQVE